MAIDNYTPEQIEEILQAFFEVAGTRQYIGARYVPIFGRGRDTSVDWDQSGAYEPLSIVYYQGDTYTSRRYVPAGISIDNQDYWVITGRYNAQVEQYRQEVLSFDRRITANESDILTEQEARIAADESVLRTVADEYVPFPDPNVHPKYGDVGQVLSTLGSGATEWVDPVIVTSEIAAPLIEDWLDNHPEATTTVQDDSITDAKLVQSGGILSTVSDIRHDGRNDMGGVPMLTDKWILNTIINTSGVEVSSDGYMTTVDYFVFPYPVLIINTNDPKTGRISYYDADYTFNHRDNANGNYVLVAANTIFRWSFSANSSTPLESEWSMARNIRVIPLIGGCSIPNDENRCRNLYDAALIEGDKAFSGNTSETVYYQGGITTDYMPVESGFPIKVYVGHTSMFDSNNAPIKVAVYDEAKNWIMTLNLTQSEAISSNGWLDLRVTGYIRISVHIHQYLKKTRTELVVLSQASLHETEIEHTPTLLQGAPIDMRGYDPENEMTGWTYSGDTGTMVESASYRLSGYIPIRWNDSVKIVLPDGSIASKSFITTDNATIKLILFDSNKNWMATLNIANNDDSYVYYRNTNRIDFDGYMKVSYKYAYDFEVHIDRYRMVSELTLDRSKLVDVIVFAGQSNMAGRGVTNSSHPETAPTVPVGEAWEFRAISDPTKLYPLTEPFGVNENNVDGIDDGNLKTGSMVSAFAINYYAGNGNHPMVAVSASKGNSGIDDWQPDATTGYLSDAIQRLSDCIAFLRTNGYVVRHTYLCWCQGEHNYSSADVSAYPTKWQTMFDEFKSVGVEKCLMVRVGNQRDNATAFSDIIECQTEMAQTNQDIVMVSTDFAGMAARSMMKDNLHYYQDAYNEVGYYSGTNAAMFATLGKEPTMYDPEYTNLYYSHKN